MMTRNELAYLTTNELEAARQEARDLGNYLLAAEYAREIVERAAGR